MSGVFIIREVETRTSSKQPFAVLNVCWLLIVINSMTVTTVKQDKSSQEYEGLK